jgi:hypothetical protein
VKKKRGSTLVTVVALFAILFTTGTAILSLTLYSYKLKIAQSRKIENLYGSEAGIDASKKILELSVQAAIKKANLEVIETTNEINEKISAIEGQYSRDPSSTLTEIIDDIVENRKDGYKLFLEDENGNNDRNNTAYYVTNTDNRDVIIVNTVAIMEKQQNIFKDTYKDVLNNNLESCFENTENIYKYLNLDSNDDIATTAFPNFPVSAVLEAEYTAFGGNEYATLDLTSVFTDNSIERKIKSSYKLQIPSITYTNVANSPLLEKAIAADGNMYINSNLTVNGDIFVKGIQTTSDEDVYSKYNGGIYVNVTEPEANGGAEGNPEAITVNFNGNTSIASTLNIKQESIVNIKNGNLYANNINIGKLGGNDNSTSNNNFNVYTDLIVDNDFTYNAESAAVNINNLYAINDRTVEGGGEAKKNSSSIIINNSMDRGSITIQNDAYIMGAAYINVQNQAGEKYQTGESIAIKGNYSAYTAPITDDGNTYTFDYYNPLQLVKNKNNNPMKIEQKAEYFLDSVRADGELSNKGNITLNGEDENLYINGAYIKGGNVQGQTIVDATDPRVDKLKLKRKEFANKVYEMDSFNGYATDANNEKLLQVYNAVTVNKTVGNSVNMSTPDPNEGSDGTDSDTIVKVYKDNDRTPLRLTDEDSSGVNIDEKKGIIVTDKNIILDGDISFTGTILTTGNIQTTAESSIIINYDGALVKGLVGKYGLQDIFNVSNSSDTQIASIKMNGNKDIDASSLIKNNGWRITK